jgi:hypothetical protein
VHIRRDCRTIEREQAQTDTGKYALPGSAAAVHVGNSGASIPAVSFLVTALLPTRCDGRNPPSALLQVIRNGQGRTWTGQLNTVA